MLRERITMVVGEVRRSVLTLRTEAGDSESLGAAIGALARHLSASSGIPIHVTLDEQATRLRPEVEGELLRITQEAMTNAVRHAGRRPSTCTARLHPRRAEITVTDDGRGLGRAPRRLPRARDHARAGGPDRQAISTVSDNVPHGTVVSVRLDPPACRRESLVNRTPCSHESRRLRSA